MPEILKSCRHHEDIGDCLAVSTVQMGVVVGSVFGLLEEVKNGDAVS